MNNEENSEKLVKNTFEIQENTTYLCSEFFLSQILGLSARRIRQLNQDGNVSKIDKGKYDIFESVKRYIKMLKKGDEEIDMSKLREREMIAKVQHEEMKKRKAELIVRQMESKLHESSDVEYLWNVGVSAAKSKLLSVPTKVAPQIIGITNAKEIQSILRKEIADALSEISEYDVTKFATDFSELEDEEKDD